MLSLVVACFACSSGDKKGQQGGPPLFADRTPDTTLTAQGLTARVEIARDELGIPHMFGSTIEDVSYAQGYMHARDRMAQLDLFRHLVEGRLAEYFGDLVFSVDVENRAFMLTTDGKEVYQEMADQAPPAEKAVLEAYAAGVNLYIAQLKAGQVPLPVGYTHSLFVGNNFTPDMIPEWRPADTLAVGRLQEKNLSDSTGEDISRGRARAALPPDVYADVVRYAPPDPTAVLPDVYQSEYYGKNGCTTVSGCTPSRTLAAGSLYQGLDLASAESSSRRADPFGMNDMPEGVEGSNNWVVSGDHTETGGALVLNDPHLRFYNPPLFYHAQMDTRHYGTGNDTSSIAGISFPGITGVLIGHNEHVAWGATTVGYDVSDVYVETLNAAGDATLFNGAYVPLTRVTMSMGVLVGGALEWRDQVFEIVPHHGAIMPGTKANGKAMSRKWTGHEPVSSGTALIERTRARNIDDFMESMSKFVAGAQNWNGADVAGNTGYMPGARIPIRADVTGACDPTVPMDGTGPCEWTGMIPLNEVPRVKNRANGYVVTANNDLTGTLADNDPRNDPQYLHSSNADGFRARRITDSVEAAISGGNVTQADMVALQADTTSEEAKRFVPFILAAGTAEPALVTTLGLGDALARLATWDFTSPSGVAATYRQDGGPTPAEVQASIAASIYYAWRPRFAEAALGDEAAQYASPTDPAGTLVPFNRVTGSLYLLENPGTSRTGQTLFDDVTTAAVETRDQILLNSLKQAVDFLVTQTSSSDPSTWAWGNIHQVEVQDLFGEFGIAERVLGPFPRGGGNSTVDVAGPISATNMHYTAGPQMRFVAEVGSNGIVARSSLPGGQIDDTNSPHYDDLLPLWLRNETFPLYFETEDVVAHTEELIVLSPPE